MHQLITFFEKGFAGRDTVNFTLAEYNSSCVEVRSEARDASIRAITKTVLNYDT
jgi:hypothetical protein